MQVWHSSTSESGIQMEAGLRCVMGISCAGIASSLGRWAMALERPSDLTRYSQKATLETGRGMPSGGRMAYGGGGQDIWKKVKMASRARKLVVAWLEEPAGPVEMHRQPRHSSISYA